MPHSGLAGSMEPTGWAEDTASSWPGPLWEAGMPWHPEQTQETVEPCGSHTGSFHGEAKYLCPGRAHRPGVSLPCGPTASSYVCPMEATIPNCPGHRPPWWLSSNPPGAWAPRSQVEPHPRTCLPCLQTLETGHSGGGVEALERGFAEITDVLRRQLPAWTPQTWLHLHRSSAADPSILLAERPAGS